MIDIQAGDVVVCVDDDWVYPIPEDPKRGDVLRVIDVVWGMFLDGSTGLALGLVGKPRSETWNADCFEKIKPATEEFTARIKAVRPIRQREDA